MKKVSADVGGGAVVTWVDKEGVRCGLPLVKLDGEWRQVGVYWKWGISPSDPKYKVVFPLPHGWEPQKSPRIMRALRRAEAA